MTDPSDVKNGHAKPKHLISIITESMGGAEYKDAMKHIRMHTLANSTNRTVYYENVVNNLMHLPPSEIDFRRKTDLEAVRELGDFHDGSNNELSNLTIKEVEEKITDGKTRVNAAILANDKLCSTSLKEIASACIQCYAILINALSSGAKDKLMMTEAFRNNENMSTKGHSNAFTAAHIMYAVFVTKALGKTPSQLESHRSKLEYDLRVLRQKTGQTLPGYVREWLAAEKEATEGGARPISLLGNQMQFTKGLSSLYDEFANRYMSDLVPWPASMQQLFDAVLSFTSDELSYWADLLD